MGINRFGDIVGDIGAGTLNDPYQGYTSSSPYEQFAQLSYSGAESTFVTSLSSNVSNQIVAGYVGRPPSLGGTWGFARINGILSLLKDHKGVKGTSTLTEILGVNDSAYGVGTYRTIAGTNAGFVVNIPTEQFTDLKTPGASDAAGTGINKASDIAGWETLPSGTVAFFRRLGVYYALSYPQAVLTKALALNSQDQLVGYYQNSSGGTKHGFLLKNPGKPKQRIWQEIDAPNATGDTVITGINDSGHICGYFVDSSGVQHGFVAGPSN